MTPSWLPTGRGDEPQVLTTVATRDPMPGVLPGPELLQDLVVLVHGALPNSGKMCRTAEILSRERSGQAPRCRNAGKVTEAAWRRSSAGRKVRLIGAVGIVL